MPRKPKIEKQTITILVNSIPITVTLHPPTRNRKSWYAYWTGLVTSRVSAHQRHWIFRGRPLGGRAIEPTAMRKWMGSSGSKRGRVASPLAWAAFLSGRVNLIQSAALATSTLRVDPVAAFLLAIVSDRFGMCLSPDIRA